MKVIFIGPAWPYRGGIADYSERLARQFIAEGDQVEFCTFTVQYPKPLFPGKTQYSPDPAPKDLLIHRRMNSVNPFTWKPSAKAIAQSKPDLVIFAWWMSFMGPCFNTIARYLRRKGIRCVALVHNLQPHERTILDRLFIPGFVKRMDGFVSMSHKVHDDIAATDKHQKPNIFCPHPLYDNFGKAVSREEGLNHLGLKPRTPYVLFFGLIREYKGLDLLMKALADERLKHVQLLVAGECYGHADKYEQIMREYNLGKRIHWSRSFIPSEEVRYWFAAADIVAQPYRSATQSGVTQIAYHFEVPMLVTNVGGLAEIVPDRRVGYVVEPDSQQIADALCDYFTAQRQQEFTTEVAKEKKRYTWANMTKAVRQAASMEK